MPMTTLDQSTKTNSLSLKPVLPTSDSRELLQLQLIFPWMPTSFVDERTQLKNLFPWISDYLH